MRVGLLACAAIAIGSSAAVIAAAEPTAAARPARRVAWTTSRLRGAPDRPPPYRVQTAFPQLKFRQPVELSGAPAIDRLFVAEQAGRIYSFPNDPNCRRPDLVIDLKRACPNLSAIYGLTFHPRYAENRFVYVCYVLEGDAADGSCDHLEGRWSQRWLYQIWSRRLPLYFDRRCHESFAARP
jgi:hypothetical protein